MNPNIKRLLKLSSIPGFRLSQAEAEELEAWKAAQEGIVVKKTTRRKKAVKKEEPEVVEEPAEIEKVQNVITPEELTLNEVES